MEFVSPEFFWLIAVPLFVIIIKTKYKFFNRKNIIWFTLCMLISIVLAQPLVTYQKETPSLIVYCIDISKSISPSELEQIITTVKTFEKKREKTLHDSKYILFGEKLHFHSKLPNEIIQENASSINEAIEAALIVIAKENKPGQIVLATDASAQEILETSIYKCKELSIPIFTLHPPERNNEFYLRQVATSPHVYQNQQIEFTIRYTSNFDGKLNIRVLANQEPYTMQEMYVFKGEQTYKLFAPPLAAGDYYFEFEVNNDNRPENNFANTFTTVTKKPKVLLIGKPQENYLERSFQLYNIDITRDSKEIDLCEAVVLVNTKGEDLSFVLPYLEKGGRVLCLGQTDNYDWLPGHVVPDKQVEPDKVEEKKDPEIPEPEKKEDPVALEIRSTAFVFVIDRSQSMEGEKLQAAQISALETIRKLWTKDTIGVIAFDNEPEWVLPLSPVSDFAWIEKRLASISCRGGGTIIKSALAMAYQKLRQTPAHIKHVVLLSDGIGDFLSRGTIVNMVSEMQSRNISISTIGIGEDIDSQLLIAIADKGKGTFYFAKDHTEIKSFFINDVDRILDIRGPIPKGQEPKENEIELPPIPKEQPEKEEKIEKIDKTNFGVVKIEPSILLSKFEQFPSIRQYYQYKTKQNAKEELIIKTKEQNIPILTFWNWRAGEVILWASNDNEWQNWKNYSEFWNTLLYYLLRKNINELTAELYVDNFKSDGAHLRLDFYSSLPNIQISSNEKFIKESTYSWLANAKIETKPKTIKVDILQQKQTLLSKSIQIAKPYLSEYNDLTVKNQLLEQLAQQTNGGLFTKDQQKILQIQTIKDKKSIHDSITWIVLVFIFVFMWLVLLKN